MPVRWPILYFARHDGQAVTVDQFVQCFADVSGRDFSQFMRWYTQAGTPEIVVTPHYDARAKTYRLDVAQKIPPTIPLTIGLLGKNGGELPLVLDGYAGARRFRRPGRTHPHEARLLF